RRSGRTSSATTSRRSCPAVTPHAATRSSPSPHTTTTSASARPTRTATRSSTASRTTRPASPCCSRSRTPSGRTRPPAPPSSSSSRARSRGCWGPRTTSPRRSSPSSAPSRSSTSTAARHPPRPSSGAFPAAPSPHWAKTQRASHRSAAGPRNSSGRAPTPTTGRSFRTASPPHSSSPGATGRGSHRKKNSSSSSAGTATTSPATSGSPTSPGPASNATPSSASPWAATSPTPPDGRPSHPERKKTDAHADRARPSPSPRRAGSGDQTHFRQLDLRPRKQLRHRTILLRRLGVLAERRLVDPRNPPLRRQLDPRDRETVPRLLQVHLGRRLDPLRLEPGTRQPRRERHREATRVRRREQLLRVRALPFLEARRERVRPLVRPALHPHLALPLPQRPRPLRRRRPYRHTLLPMVFA